MRYFWMMMIMAGLATVLHAGKGKIRVSADQEGAYIYIDGKKRAMTAEGFTSILVDAGEYEVRVVKEMDEWNQAVATKRIFVGEDTSTKITLKLQKEKTPAYKTMMAKKDAIKRARWKRKGEIVVDNKTGWMWQDNSAVSNTKRDWKGAKRYCQKLTFGGYSDWRLPDYEALNSIIDYERYNPAIIPAFKHVNTSDYYWSSSQYVSNDEVAWFVFFKDGYAYYYNKATEYYVRCVRGRQ